MILSPSTLAMLAPAKAIGTYNPRKAREARAAAKLAARMREAIAPAGLQIIQEPAHRTVSLESVVQDAVEIMADLGAQQIREALAAPGLRTYYVSTGDGITAGRVDTKRPTDHAFLKVRAVTRTEARDDAQAQMDEANREGAIGTWPPC